jgi:hypothetical protein
MHQPHKKWVRHYREIQLPLIRGGVQSENAWLPDVQHLVMLGLLTCNNQPFIAFRR